MNDGNHKKVVNDNQKEKLFKNLNNINLDETETNFSTQHCFENSIFFENETTYDYSNCLTKQSENTTEVLQEKKSDVCEQLFQKSIEDFNKMSSQLSKLNKKINVSLLNKKLK